MTDKIPPEDLKEMKQAFAFYDKDKDGKLSPAEASIALRAVGMMSTEKELAALHGGAPVDEAKFLKILSEPKKIHQDDVLKAFKIFDKEKGGTCPNADLKHALVTLAEKLPESEADLFIKLGSQDGKVNYKEFVQTMAQYK